MLKIEAIEVEGQEVEGVVSRCEKVRERGEGGRKTPGKKGAGNRDGGSRGQKGGGQVRKGEGMRRRRGKRHQEERVLVIEVEGQVPAGVVDRCEQVRWGKSEKDARKGRCLK